jgi:cytochrome c553
MSCFKIALSIAVASFFIGCGDDNTAANSVNTQSVVEQKTDTAAKSVDEASKAAEIVVKEATKEAKTLAADTQNAAEETANSVDETTKVAVEEIKEAAAAATVAPMATISGADLYKACASCHGQNAEKPALGKSQIIKGWEASKIAAALHGYKDGTYGAAMKSVMKGQASKLNDADIQAVSEYISKL